MKTPKDFDYDLWTEDGKYFVRIKSTREQCEVNHATMRLIRNEEMKLKRSYEKLANNPTLSFDLLTDETEVCGNGKESVTSSLLNPKSPDDVCAKMMSDKFAETLTPFQRVVYENCVVAGMSNTECANLLGLRESNIRSSLYWIRKKAKVFFAEE